MKNNFKIKLLSLSLVILFCNAAWAAKWVEVIPRIYVDLESATFYDNRADFWVKNISKHPYLYKNHQQVAFILTHQVASCCDGLMATIGTYKYRPDGHRISAYHDEVHAENEFKPVVPDTISSDVFNYMCKKYKAQKLETTQSDDRPAPDAQSVD